jgi:uncharacterized cysteine cluster protein YcgN (CxxCxxCC family)
MTDKFWERPLKDLNKEEWEALCDGCGKCCVHKLQDDISGEFQATNVTCRLLDRHSGRCTDYKRRKSLVPDCVRLTYDKVDRLTWLPSTCAYRLRAAGEPLPDWHYLVCGDPEAVHKAGISVRGWTISEDDAGDLEHHLIDREL